MLAWLSRYREPLTNSEGYFDQKSPIYYEDITFRDILFDSSYRGGGIFVIDSARNHIHDCFFIHFTSEGILVQKGYETFISTCFLGQCSTIGGDKGERDFSGTAIDLASNDNAVIDATVFGGVGILVKSAQNRIHNCYMDYNAILIEDPFQVQVANGFFLGDGNIVLKSIKGKISGLNIINNMFSGEPKNMVPIVKLDGQFTSIDQVVIAHNNVDGMSLKSTVGKLAVSGNGTKWVIDFSSVLVFPNKINHVHYSFYTPGVNVVGFPLHAMTNVSSNVVVVE
ncbi:hypothetical protein ACSBR2_013885 [Camellia fascicularis]